MQEALTEVANQNAFIEQLNNENAFSNWIATLLLPFQGMKANEKYHAVARDDEMGLPSFQGGFSRRGKPGVAFIATPPHIKP